MRDEGSEMRDEGSIAPAQPLSLFVRAALLCLILAAITVRLLHWPAQHDLRDGDELPYAWGSLQLLEGNLPGIHFAPAGPQTWVGWCFEAVISLKHFALPDRVERASPLPLRPFLAIDHTLFDAYRDTGPLRQVWVWTSFLLAIGGVVAGFRLGLDKAGMAGAILMGGTMALLPLFVEFSVQARPYAVAWSFGIIALYYALASSRPRALAISAVMMGLAVGSRIDMLILLPVIWSEAWQRSREGEIGRWGDGENSLSPPLPVSRSPLHFFLRTMLRYHAILLAAFLIVAPWYLMTLVAGLRAVATVRSGAGLAVAKPGDVFLQVVWDQGLLLQVPLFLLGAAVWAVRKPRRWLLAIYVLLAGLSVFKGAAFGLRYQGAPLILVILGAVCGLRRLQIANCKLQIANFQFSILLGLLSLVLPAVQTSRMIIQQRGNYVPDLSTEWVESHVPAGTILYAQPWIFNPLPTAKAADADWAELTDNSAYQRKFKAVMRRFELDANPLEQDIVPRALSEVNLALERGNRRGQFILGGRHWAASPIDQKELPRYDIRVFNLGPVFGVRDLSAAFRQTGGAVVLRGPADDPLVKELGKPVKEWLSPSGSGTRIYCSPDIASRLQ